MQEFQQYGAMPVATFDGQRHVLLITSRGTQRWIIPKGWPKRGVAPHEQAAREAYEEAGLRGRISERPIGAYHYTKRLHVCAWARVTVTVFELLVEREEMNWPEATSRTRRWFTPQDAADRVKERGLAEIILAISGGSPAADALLELDPKP